MTYEDYIEKCDEALDYYLDSQYGRITMIDCMIDLRASYVNEDTEFDTVAQRISRYGYNPEADGDGA